MILSPLGRYEVISLLGGGGMGGVYLARDTSVDREVTIKVPRRRSNTPRPVLNLGRSEG